MTVGTTGAYYSARIAPANLDVKHVELILPRLKPAFDGFRLLQISDIHMDQKWMDGVRLAGVIDRILEQEVDLVAMTGDYVTYDADTNASDLVSAFTRLTNQRNTVAVLGNHDHWTNPTLLHEVLAQSSVIDLTNDVYTLERGNSLLHIGGVDDIWEHKQRIDLVLDKLPNEGSAILLAHEPDYVDETVTHRRFDLQLSGHSHGGQVVLPLIGTLILPDLGRKYPSGLYQVGDMWQYTSRGIGMVAPRVRFNCSPEITVFTLKTSKS